MADRYYLGIDVGTGSVRAGVFDARGARRGVGTHPIKIGRPEEDFVEQSSDDIWRAAGVATREALAEARVAKEQIVGLGFDATCSLVALGEGDRPVSVSPTGDPAWNVIVWMDHRAVAQAKRINELGHEVLRYVGGVISPEMQTPKILWLKERAPAQYAKVRRFVDLPDFLTRRATGSEVRSLCTTTCKWTYLGHEGRWDASYFERVGLGDHVADGFERIGREVRAMGERAGGLTEEAAAELGLAPGTAVAVSIIDAHAGGLGMIGATIDGKGPTPETIEERLALIGGTSTCHMAVSREPKFVPGVWGPYKNAMVPEMWLTEGGQSATGALLDHVVTSHARGRELAEEAARRGTHVHALLNERLDVLARAAPFPAALTHELHVFPDFHGNRSPRADPSLRGMVSGLRLTETTDSLALLYLATVQALALGTRHIVEAMNRQGYRIDVLLACGGDAKNPLFLREHADATGCRVVLPDEPEAVLVGAAILGAVAAGDRASVLDAMSAMSRAGKVIEPARGPVATYHARKYDVFQAMYEHQMDYRRRMGELGA